MLKISVISAMLSTWFSHHYQNCISSGFTLKIVDTLTPLQQRSLVWQLVTYLVLSPQTRLEMVSTCKKYPVVYCWQMLKWSLFWQPSCRTGSVGTNTKLEIPLRSQQKIFSFVAIYMPQFSSHVKHIQWFYGYKCGSGILNSGLSLWSVT